jgi:hypothetical protein
MKPGVNPAVSAAWWKANKGTLAPAEPLAGALAAYEAARLEFAKLAAALSPKAREAHTAALKLLEEGVQKAADDTIKKLNKLTSKDTIEGVGRYRSQAIPREKGELAKLLRPYEDRVTRAVADVNAARDHQIDTLTPVAREVADAVVTAQATLVRINQALIDATAAKTRGDAGKADEAKLASVKLAAAVAKLLAESLAKTKDLPRQVPFDKSLFSPAESNAYNRKVDRASSILVALDANLDRLRAADKQARESMSQTGKLSGDVAQAAKLMVQALERLLARAQVLLAETDDQLRKFEGKYDAAEGEMERAKAQPAGSGERAEMVKTCRGWFKDGIAMAPGVKASLDRAVAEITGTRDKLPASIVKADQPEFAEPLKKLDEYLKEFAKSQAKYDKALRKLSADAQLAAKLQ